MRLTGSQGNQPALHREGIQPLPIGCEKKSNHTNSVNNLRKEQRRIIAQVQCSFDKQKLVLKTPTNNPCIMHPRRS
ncbi:hypothetical protein I7I50_00439 [Histoplasma capsulatum G186AR]|nr:hypothetical protein I7I52_07707 [Histoplasma capsulatum]QSS72559.1 hypothetical protein I7I50_00439 [Histoplasma capsulatum G186AR]